MIARLKTARPELDGKAALEAVWERELKFASAVGRGVIVPHARLPGLSEPIIAVEPTMPLREAGELMIDHGASHVLVISPEGQRPVGVLSTLDVAGVLAWGEG